MILFYGISLLSHQIISKTPWILYFIFYGLARVLVAQWKNLFHKHFDFFHGMCMILRGKSIPWNTGNNRSKCNATPDQEVGLNECSRDFSRKSASNVSENLLENAHCYGT